MSAGMNRRRFLLAGGAAAAATTAGRQAASAAPLAREQGRNITVNFSKVLTPVDPLGVGWTCSTYKGNGAANMNASAEWKAKLAKLGAGHVRIPLRWNHGDPGSGAGGAQSSGDADKYVKNIRGMGALPFAIYGGDASDNGGLNGSDVAAFVKRYNGSGGAARGGPVRYWIVGNEPDNGGGSGAYLRLLPGVISAMHRADSSVVISAPAAAYWDTGLLQAAAKVDGVGILSYHAYNGGDPAPGGFPNERAYHDNIEILRSWKRGIHYGVEEVNWHFQGGSPAFFEWKNTCFIADAAGQVLTAGGHFTQYSDSNGPLGLLNDGTGQGQPGSFGTPLPAYWGLGIWTGMAGQFKKYSRNMVPVSTTFAGTTLSAFACDNGKVVLVNKDTSTHQVTIGMNGRTSGTYEVWATQRNNPAGPIRKVASGHYSRGEISCTVPAGTAVSIDVS
jgi:hypothetical protein